MTSDVILQEQESLQKKESEITQLLSIEENTEYGLATFQMELEKFVNLKLPNNEVLRQMLHNLISKIEVLADGTIAIHYNFRNPILRGGLT